MPKGPALTAAEREEIATLRKANLSAREIALKITRSKTVVLNYLKSPSTYGTVKRSGRRRALSKAQEAQIISVLLQRGSDPQSEAGDVVRGGGGGGRAVEPTLSAERIKKEFDLPLSIRRIQQLLADWRRDARKAVDKQYALTEEDSSRDEETDKREEEESVVMVVEEETEADTAAESGAMDVVEEDVAEDPLVDSTDAPPIEAQV